MRVLDRSAEFGYWVAVQTAGNSALPVDRVQLNVKKIYNAKLHACLRVRGTTSVKHCRNP